FRRKELVIAAVADRELEVLVVRAVDDHDLLVRLERRQRAEKTLGLDLLQLDFVDDDEVALFGELRERRAERADAHLARRTVAPVARARRVGLAAADVDRRALRAVTRLSRALLLVDLLRRAADGAALFRGRRSLATRGELRFHDLVEELFFDFAREHFVREIERAHLLSLHVE